MTHYLSLFLFSCLLMYLMGFLVRRLGWVYALLDYPEERKIHVRPIPMVGGFGIFVVLVVSVLFLSSQEPLTVVFRKELSALILGGAILVMLGIWDDLRGSGAMLKLSVQAVVALIAWWAGLRIERITLPLVGQLELGAAGLLLTILWYCLIINALNLIDGLDGLAAGISSIVAFTIFLISYHWSQPLASFLALIILGVCLGFLPHNFHPARLFLGDQGSMLLGFLLGSLALLTGTKTPTLITLLVPLILLGLPLFDTGVAFFRRSLSRRTPFRADRKHVHHYLLSLGFSHSRVVVLIYYISAYLALTAYTLALAPPEFTVLTFLLLALGSLIIVEVLLKKPQFPKE